MFDKHRRVFGSAIAVLLAISCLFIGKVVALDVPHSPLGVLLKMVEVAAPANANADTGVSEAGRPVLIDAAPVALAHAAAPANPAVDTAPAHPATKRSLHLVTRDSSGAITGNLQVAEYINGADDQLQPAVDTSVKFVSHCSVAYQTTTDESGNFRVEGVRDGIYTLLADGPSGLLVMRIAVQENPAAPAVPLTALLVPNVDAHYVRTLIDQHLPKEVSLSKYISFDRIAESVPPPTPSPVHLVNANAKIPASYELSGRVLRLNPASGSPVPVSETSAELVRNGRGVTPVAIGADGQCEAKTLESEYYSFVAVGSDGVCAVGIEAGGDATPPATPDVPPAPNPCYTEMAVVPLDDCGAIVEAEEVLEPIPCCDEFGAAGSAGGGYGGGGGGGGYGGGGGLGLGLLGLAGLAGLAGIDNGNGGQIIRIPATPF